MVNSTKLIRNQKNNLTPFLKLYLSPNLLINSNSIHSSSFNNFNSNSLLNLKKLRIIQPKQSTKSLILLRSFTSSTIKFIPSSTPSSSKDLTSNSTTTSTTEKTVTTTIKLKGTRLQRIWSAVKKEALHYWHGTKLLGKEIRISARIQGRLLAGKKLTRREHRQVCL